MKKIIFLSFVLLMICQATSIHAQRRQENPKLAVLINQKDTVLLNKQLDSLAGNNREDDLNLLVSYYSAKQNAKKRDEIARLTLQKFPNGRTAFNEIGERIYNERNPEQNEKNYSELVARFGSKPEFNIDGSRYYVAITFLGKDKPQKVLEYLNMIENPTYKTNAFSYAAREAIGVQDYKFGETLIRKTFADLNGDTTHRGMDEFRRIFSELLFANGKYEEGFPHAKLIYDKKSQTTAVGVTQLSATYHNYLIKLKKYKEAYPEMLSMMKSGNATPLIKESFKMAYVSVNGTDKGYDEFAKNISQSLKENIRKDVADKMVNIKAFDFELKDLSGNIVRLSDFKGKVVVLDFWATWCGPCKASFPKMQLAVDKYRSDNNVVFLFVHTMETAPDPAKAAGDYIREKKFSFRVLIDSKDPKTMRNTAADGFNVRAIPTKIIIDGNGNTRFLSTGNKAGGNDAFIEEMGAMIDLSRNK